MRSLGVVLNKIKSEAPVKIKPYVKNTAQRAVKFRRRGRRSGVKYIFHTKPCLCACIMKKDVLLYCTVCMRIYGTDV